MQIQSFKPKLLNLNYLCLQSVRKRRREESLCSVTVLNLFFSWSTEMDILLELFLQVLASSDSLHPLIISELITNYWSDS